MHKDTIIIGAGPAGIQLGTFLQQGGYDYIIFEQNDNAGSFFNTFPHIGKLISINKKYTGYSSPEFNLRHDWNSLLSEKGPLFTSYSNDYYPNRDDLQRYLHDFSIINQVQIQYNSKVLVINQLQKGYQIIISFNNQQYEYTCVKLVVAKGLSLKIPSSIINKTNIPILHYGQYPRNYFLSEKTIASFINKSLAIIGSGNSAMELANHFVPYCSKIMVFGKSHKYNHPWSISTNYTGDVRALYLAYFDTFLLKSMNAYDVLHPFFSYDITHEDGKFKFNNYSFDHIIFATGWEFDTSIFSFSNSLDLSGKYPSITPEYESTSHPGLYFIGSLGHSLDRGKSSGGFIHGFRYLIRYFYQLHYQESFPVVYFPLQFDLEKINWNIFTNELFSYLNRTSAMYQMYGIIGTIFYKKNNIMNILYDVSINLYHFTVHKCNPLLSVSEELVFIITFEYGKVKNNLVNKIAIRNHGNDELLRPVVRIYKQHKLLYEFHFEEDIYGEFIDYNMYHQKFIDILEKWY